MFDFRSAVRSANAKSSGETAQAQSVGVFDNPYGSAASIMRECPLRFQVGQTSTSKSGHKVYGAKPRIGWPSSQIRGFESQFFVAVAAADLGDLDRSGGPATGGGDLDPPADEPKQSRSHPGLEHQVRAGVGHHDPGNPALAAQVWRPVAASRCLVDQPALLPIATTVEIFEVVGALAASWGAHSQFIAEEGRIWRSRVLRPE